MKHYRKHLVYVFAVLLCVLFGLAAAAINLNRFWQYEAGYYDLGIFDHAIWLVSQGKLPIIDHFRVSGKIIFADHFSPSIFLFSPLYWFVNKTEMLLIAQDVLVAASGWVLYLIGVKVLKNRYLALAPLVAYFLFIGLQNAIFHDFHEVTVMTFFLMMVFYAFVTNNKKLYALFFLLTLGFKESLFLLGTGLSVFIFFYDKKWRHVAVTSLIISLVWGFTTLKIIIPHFAGTYYYTPETTRSASELFAQLFTPFIKIKTVFLTFLSFLFLPLMNLSLTFIVLLNFASRFLLDSSTRWDLGLHYNAEIAPTLAFGSILALHSLQKKLGLWFVSIVGILLIVVSCILYRFVFHGPFGLAYHPVFWAHTKDFVFLDRAIQTVPKNAKVVAQNNLASRFLHQDVWILREDYKRHNADYILIDVREGQNPNNYLGLKDPKKLLGTLLNDKRYEIHYHDGDQYVFKKKQ